MIVKQEIVAAILEDLKHIPDHYLESVQHIVHSIRVNAPPLQLSREDELLRLIHEGLSEAEENRLDELDYKRRDKLIGEEEYKELLELVNKVETFNANRLKYLSELAQIRNTDLVALMQELNIKPRVRA